MLLRVPQTIIPTLRNVCLFSKVKSDSSRCLRRFLRCSCFLVHYNYGRSSYGNRSAACYNSTRFPWKELVSFLSLCFDGVILMQPSGIYSLENPLYIYIRFIVSREREKFSSRRYDRGVADGPQIINFNRLFEINRLIYLISRPCLFDVSFRNSVEWKAGGLRFDLSATCGHALPFYWTLDFVVLCLKIPTTTER